MVVNSFFWRGKRVFLTGHTGFKGSWLSLWLHSMGSEVTGFALEPITSPNLFDILRLDSDINSIIGDVRNLEQLKFAFEKADPEIVIHMAAQPLVRRSYKHPIETYSTNVMGTVNMLELVRSSKNVKAIVNVTSDKCYDNREGLEGYQEGEPMGGSDPYSSSKGCAELVTSSYRSSFFSPTEYTKHGVALASVRAGNVIGGGDWAEDRLIPDFIKSIVSGNEILIRNPKAIRPWQHVLEPLSGYLILAEKLFDRGISFAEAWNFGPLNSEDKNVEWILNKFIFYWGEHINFKIDQKNINPHETHHLNLNSSKARKILGWRSKWDAEDAVRHACFWYKAYLQNEDMKFYCLNEIKEHQIYKQTI